MDNPQEKIIVDFLNVCGIPCESLTTIDGLIIPRETLLKEEIYNKACQHVEKLKEIYSSSYMTSLQKTAKSNQAWPLINIVRQVLKSCGYNMTPKGYLMDIPNLVKNFTGVFLQLIRLMQQSQ